MPDTRPCCTMVWLVPQLMPGSANGVGVSQPCWAPMMPVGLASAPVPDSMASGVATGMAQGAYGDLAVASMPMPLLPEHYHYQHQHQHQQQPEHSSTEQMWQAAWWAHVEPSGSMEAVPQLDIQQYPVERGAEPEVQKMGDIKVGSRLPTVSAIRQRRPQRVSDGSCAADVEPDAACGDDEHEDARPLADLFLEQLRRSGTDHSGESRAQTLERFRRMAFASKAQCRAAQLVLKEVSVKDCVALAGGLRGHVRASMGSMYANFVLQKVVELTPAAASSFVAEELTGVGAETARHRYGCRILCRLLEFGAADEPATHQLFEEVLADVGNLLRHSFGGYVVQHFLEFGSKDHKRRVGQAVRQSLVSNAVHQRGSRIVEAALQQCAEEDRRAMAEDLLASREEVLYLAENQFGCHVVKALLRTSEGNRRQIAEILRPVKEHMRQSKYGKHVLAACNAGSAKDARSCQHAVTNHRGGECSALSDCTPAFPRS